MAMLKTCVVFLFLTISSAYGLTCYQCDSSESALCNYGFTRFFYNTVDCSKQNNDNPLDVLNKIIPQQCVKITAKTKDGSEYVGRGCVPYSGEACNAVVKALSFFSSLEGNIEDMNCYTCNEDKCNSANRLGRGFGVVGLVFAAIAFLL